MAPEDITALRKRMGWAQWELAEKLGTTQASISRMENRDRPITGPTAKLLEMLNQMPTPEPVQQDGAAA